MESRLRELYLGPSIEVTHFPSSAMQGPYRSPQRPEENASIPIITRRPHNAAESPSTQSVSSD